jgi:hypothetical protein
VKIIKGSRNRELREVRCAPQPKKKRRKLVLREQTAVVNCEEAVSVLSVYENKEKLGRFFFSCETYTKGIWGFL